MVGVQIGITFMKENLERLKKNEKKNKKLLFCISEDTSPKV